MFRDYNGVAFISSNEGWVVGIQHWIWTVRDILGIPEMVEKRGRKPTIPLIKCSTMSTFSIKKMDGQWAKRV